MKPTFLNHERPLLCAMLQYKTVDETIGAIRNGIANGAEAFGLQVECLGTEHQDIESFKRLVAEMKDKPCYVTNYRKGSNKDKSDEELAEEMLVLAENGATLCDVMGDMFLRTPGELTMDETAIKKVQLYPYWTNDTFHDCTLTASAYYAEYEDLYVDFDAARYYIGTYKGKNADGLSLSARFMGMLYFYDAQGNLLRVATSEDIGHDWEFDLSGVSFVKLGGKVAVRFFWLEGF